MTSEIGPLIATLGFPIVAYLLVYLDLRKKLEELKNSIDNMNQSFTKLGVELGKRQTT